MAFHRKGTGAVSVSSSVLKRLKTPSPPKSPQAVSAAAAKRKRRGLGHDDLLLKPPDLNAQINMHNGSQSSMMATIGDGTPARPSETTSRIGLVPSLSIKDIDAASRS